MDESEVDELTRMQLEVAAQISDENTAPNELDYTPVEELEAPSSLDELSADQESHDRD